MHHKLCYLAGAASFLGFLLFFSPFVIFIHIGAAPSLNQTQPVYGNVIYSPFSKLDYRYNHIEVALHYESISLSNKFNLTICQAPCPLKTNTKQFVYNGSCPIDRSQYNCYAKLSKEDIEPDSSPECFSKFIVKNSKIKFSITELNETESLSVQLCITTNKDHCKYVFWPGPNTHLNLQQICLRMITFNKSNHFTQTFTAPDDSYYCAVWVLERDQWLYYTVNSIIEAYNITDYSPHLCESHNVNHPSHVTFPLHSSNPMKTACIILQQNTVERWDRTTCDNIVINSTAFKPLTTAAWVTFSVFVGLILMSCILISFAIIFCMIKLYIVQYYQCA